MDGIGIQFIRGRLLSFVEIFIEEKALDHRERGWRYRDGNKTKRSGKCVQVFPESDTK